MRAAKKDPELCRSHPGCEPGQEPVTTLPDQIDPLFGREEQLVGEEPQEAYIPWAKPMKRVHGIDVLRCPCGGTRKVMSYVTDPETIREGLERLGLSGEA